MGAAPARPSTIVASSDRAASTAFGVDAHVRGQFFPGNVESVEEEVHVGWERCGVYQLASFRG
jgi:hypothetical protein